MVYFLPQRLKNVGVSCIFLLIYLWEGSRMNEKMVDLLYAIRGLCESLKEQHEFLDHNDEIKEYVDDIEASLGEISELEEE
jgi:hypothetical protein